MDARTSRVVLGLAATLVLSVVVLAPFLRSTGPNTQPTRPAVSALASATARDAELRAEALSAATSLASTLTELARLRAARGSGVQPQHSPPPASAFPSETACLASYLPALGPVDPTQLGFVCKQSDLWAIERQAHRLMAGKPGQAAQLWKRLGPYSLAALAVMRSGCCIEAEPVTAVVPGLWCGVLRDKMRLFTSLPERSTVDDFERTIGCLARRGARLPAHWATVPAGRGQRAFDEFMAIARARR